jgi:SAM-dependent methyltransferase
VVKIINDIQCFAPESAYGSSDFPKTAFAKLYQQEENNFWFRSRNRIIQFLLKKYLFSINNKKLSFLEVGCGTGYVLKGLSAFSELRLVGADIYLEGLKYAKLRLPEVSFIQLDASHLPFENEFDAVGIFDVLEHLENDADVIKNIHRALNLTGYLFITVPQHKFMWSKVDERSCHKRRYSRAELEAILNTSGFNIEYIGSFLFILFPVMLMSRWLQGRSNVTSHSHSFNEFDLSSPINACLEIIMKVEELLVRMGISLPFGGSLVVVCKKEFN